MFPWGYPPQQTSQIDDFVKMKAFISAWEKEIKEANKPKEDKKVTSVTSIWLTLMLLFPFVAVATNWALMYGMISIIEMAQRIKLQ